MAYTVGDTISNSDYNGLLNNTASGTPNAGVAARGINYIAGTGAGEYGLGQTELNTVGATDTIQAAQWNSLFTFMNNIANHTNDTLTSTTAVSAGDTIAIKAALESNLNTLAASVAAGSPNATALTTSAAQVTSAASGIWNVSHIVEQSVTFNSANEMRWFFNQGGRIQINVTRTGNGGSAATAKDLSIDDLIDSLGNFQIKATTSIYSDDGSTNVNLTTDGSTTSTDLNIGFYDLTTTYQTILVLRQDFATYEFMQFRIEAKLDAAPGSSTVMTIRTSLLDPQNSATDGLGRPDNTYTAGNTSGVDQYANWIGVTNVILTFVNPNTDEGLATVYTPASAAEVSDNIVTLIA
jgi:hypothetical protein